MRIALVHQSGGERGGAERYLASLERSLAARGHDVSRRDPAAARDPRALAADLARASDVVHLHHVEDAGFVAALEASAAPVVWSIHDLRPVCPGANRLDRAGHTCSRFAARRCALQATLGGCAGLSRWPLASVLRVHRWARWVRSFARRWPVVVASVAMRDRVAGQGWPESGITVAPYPVELPALGARSASSGSGVLFAGRLVEPDKGLGLLAEVMARLPPATRGVVAGDGPSRTWLAARLAELGAADRVELSGWLESGALAERLDAAAVVVMTSAWPEPSGLVGLEALAHARPVVATDVGGVAEWLRDGETGHRVPAGDVVVMVDRVRALLADPARRDAMGAAGRAWVERHRSPAAHAARLERLYASVARGGSHRSEP